jgi:hypothetical protein
MSLAHNDELRGPAPGKDGKMKEEEKEARELIERIKKLGLNDATIGEMVDEIERLRAKTDGGAEVPCSDGLDGLAQAWDEAARYYKNQEEKQATKYLKGMRAGAAYKLESCANELRALVKEQAV